MLSLQDKIKELGSKAKKYQERNIPEPGTKSGLIEPLFREIGWNFENIENVEPEFPVRLGEETKPADYALKIDGEPSLFIEAKRVNLDIKEAIADGTAKAIKKGVPWLIATNGDEIAVLKIDEKIPDAERVVFQIVLSESVGDEKKIKENAELLALLSPENVISGKLEGFSMERLKRTRILNIMKKYFQSNEFIKSIGKRHKKTYRGEEPDLNILRKLTNEINIGVEREHIIFEPKPKDLTVEIKKRMERLFKYPGKKEKERIDHHIFGKKELWVEFIQRKEMSSADFKDFAEFKKKATGAFSAFLTANGLATNVGYDDIRRAAIWRINEEIIPEIEKILNIKTSEAEK